MDGRNGGEERRRIGDGDGRRGQWKEEKGGKGTGKQMENFMKTHP